MLQLLLNPFIRSHHFGSLGISQRKMVAKLPKMTPLALRLPEESSSTPLRLMRMTTVKAQRPLEMHKSLYLVNTVQRVWSSTLAKLPLGIQTFSEIIKENYVYIDKTKPAYNLITRGAGRYFFGASRRFGKSLYVSTLEEIFLGNRLLFKGCFIDSTDYQWKKYPVIKLDFSNLEKDNEDLLKYSLIESLKKIARDYGHNLQHLNGLSDATTELIHKLSGEDRQVVILVDEYDSPIVEHIENGQKARSNIRLLRQFFTTIKALDKYVKFIFVTGVSRFSHVTLFSGMNLDDISMQSEYGSIVGYTETEIKKYLSEHVKAVADKTGETFEEALGKMREWYNGYRFSKDAELVYNPWSVMHYLKSQEFGNYWYESGTPAFAISSLKRTENIILIVQSALRNQIWANRNDLAAKFDVEDSVKYPISLLFQTGYLTITAFNSAQGYLLGFPNKEVRDSLLENLLPYVTEKGLDFANRLKTSMTLALLDGNAHRFLGDLRVLLADIPYQIHSKDEGYYHTIVLLATRFLGFESQAEIQTNRGSIDLVIKTPRYVYVMEFKIDRPGKAAIDQVVKKEYYKKFHHDTRSIILVGATFDTLKRDLREDWEIRSLDK